MSLSNSERQEMEILIRSVMEPMLHELECNIAAGFAEACDIWANLIADIQLKQAETVMAMRAQDRNAFLEAEERQREKRIKVKGFTR